MQVVIDISEDNFNSIYHGGLCFIGHDRLDECITEAFQTARIIPKGHGDLIDRDAITVEEDVYFQNYIIHAPTVIPADKGMCYNCQYKTDSCQEGLHCIRDSEGE